jgi:hypothetical protein
MLPFAEKIPLSLKYRELVPVRSVPLTHRFDANVEVALVPVPLTSMNPAKVEVPVPPTATFPAFDILKSVEFTPEAEVDPTANRFWLTLVLAA